MGIEYEQQINVDQQIRGVIMLVDGLKIIPLPIHMMIIGPELEIFQLLSLKEKRREFMDIIISHTNEVYTVTPLVQTLGCGPTVGSPWSPHPSEGVG